MDPQEAGALAADEALGLRFTDEQIAELRALFASEDEATRVFWATGDWLVAQIDRLGHVSKALFANNGSGELMRDAAERSGQTLDVIETRYHTARCFPPETRRLDLAWSLHRRFASRGKEHAAVWLAEFVAECEARHRRPTIRAAADWLWENHRLHENAGQESGAAMARSLVVMRDQDSKDEKAQEFVRGLDAESREAVAKAVVRDPVARHTVKKALGDPSVKDGLPPGHSKMGDDDKPVEYVSSPEQEKAIRRLAKEMEAYDAACDLIHENMDTQARVLEIHVPLSWLVKHEKWAVLRSIAAWIAAQAEAEDAQNLTPEMFQ